MDLPTGCETGRGKHRDGQAKRQQNRRQLVEQSHKNVFPPS